MQRRSRARRLLRWLPGFAVGLPIGLLVGMWLAGTMTGDFWPAFWPNLAANAVAVVLGIPAAFAIDRWIRFQQGSQERVNNRAALVVAMRAVLRSLDESPAHFAHVREMLEAGDFPVGLLVSTAEWDVTKAIILQHLDDIDLKVRLARYFEREAAFPTLLAALQERVTGITSAVMGSQKMVPGLVQDLIAAATTLEGEAPALAETIRGQGLAAQ